MRPFLVLDATVHALTLSWQREPDVAVEEVQMKKAENEDGAEWVTLSKTLTSSALRKNSLEAGAAYVFRRRSRQDQVSGAQSTSGAGLQTDQEWGEWSECSEPLRTLPEGAKQPPAPIVKLREAGAIVMEWPATPGASGYEVQMSTSGRDWVTIAPSFGSNLLRKKGLEDAVQYRFRTRPVLEATRDNKEGGGSGGGGGGSEEGARDAWRWSPATPLISPAVLNAFLKSQAPEELVGRGREVVSRNVLAGKVVAFYFSASWCGPCRKYTPQLAALYAKAKAQHKAFEIVFVSLDGDEESMAKYHAGMPWPAVPFEHHFREDFTSAKGVNSIPRLIVTGRRGQELASNAVGMTWDQLVAWEAQG